VGKQLQSVFMQKLPLATLVVVFVTHQHKLFECTDNRHVSPPAPLYFVKEQNPTQKVRTILKKHDTKVSTGFKGRFLGSNWSSSFEYS
jgi:hypothetical protein